jgi:hypothetical protein
MPTSARLDEHARGNSGRNGGKSGANIIRLADSDEVLEEKSRIAQRLTAEQLAISPNQMDPFS